jgi:hypothetical protein
MIRKMLGDIGKAPFFLEIMKGTKKHVMPKLFMFQ